MSVGVHWSPRRGIEWSALLSNKVLIVKTSRTVKMATKTCMSRPEYEDAVGNRSDWIMEEERKGRLEFAPVTQIPSRC